MRHNREYDYPFDIHNTTDTNPIVKILFACKVIYMTFMLLIGLGLLCYFGWIVLWHGHVFRDLFR